MDQTTFDKLERLAKLRADGALSDAEYDVEKAKLLAGAPTAAATGAHTVRPPEPAIDEARLSPVWRERFQLIDQHGMPNTRAYSEAMRNVAFWDRTRHVLAPLAFVLGPFYFLYLGLWRPAISLTGATIAYSFVLDALQVPNSFDRVAWVIPAVAFAWTCIPLYYLRVRRGIHSWNPMIWWGA
jgi:hypothetical protein